MELRNYETVFIMTPVLSETQIGDTIAKSTKKLEDFKAEIVYQEEPMLKKLAYPIQKKSTGIYQVIEFKALPSVISDLEREYILDDKIIRFLTISLDKHGVEYNIKKHKKEVFKEKGPKKEIKDKPKEEEKINTENEKKEPKEKTPIKTKEKKESEDKKTKETKKEGSKEGSPESV